MNFDYIENTKCLINNKEETIRLGNGCTGIGSRECWINGKKLPDNILIISDDITKGNHFLYFGCWGERPWDTDYFLVSEKEEKIFLERFSVPNVYKDPVKEAITDSGLKRA